MSSDNASGKPRMSLYANLLQKDSRDAPGTISSAPVVYKQSGESAEKSSDEIIAAAKAKLNAAALRFQPTKRPTANLQKPKNLGPKPPASTSATTSTATAVQTDVAGDVSVGINRQAFKATIEDWAGHPDDEIYYQTEKRQRGGRKKRRKNKDREPQPVNWDDIYDPSRPNSYEEYRNSEERILEIREWKDRLYAHRTARRHTSDSDSDDEPSRPLRNQFAPPGMYFAPPPGIKDHVDPSSQPRVSSSVPLSPLPVGLPEDTTGDDAYARRIRSFQQENPKSPPLLQRGPEISRAPVRYNLPPPPTEIPSNEEELETALWHDNMDQPSEPAGHEPRSSRPGQRGFAERLMNKYGWTKGSGLGAQGDGITSALRVQVEKQKRKPDAEGGGFAGPGGRGKIIGGKRQGNESDGKFGAMSEVIVLKGMVDGLDLHFEMGEGNLVQEIGEECGEKYGRVERVFIDQVAQGSAPVFVKFTSPLSALRAVNALEGRIFNGNAISAKFYDKERFDKGDYSV